MELAIQSSCLVMKPPPLSSSLHSLLLLNSHIKTSRLTVKATQSSSSSTSEEEPNNPNATNSKTSVGFGSSSSVDGKKRRKGKERASIIRRTPLGKPDFLSKEKQTQTPKQNSAETAFLLTWFGLGSLIIIEGLVLAASGLFPEEWDKYFVKYLYPAFTPTVFFFVAGTVVYGVIKYLDGEKTKN